MSWSLGLIHQPGDTKLDKNFTSKLKKLPLPSRQTANPHEETIQHKTCRSSQSTEDQESSQATDMHLLHITCYSQEYTVDLLSKQSLQKFCHEIDKNHQVSKLTKISIKMLATRKASQMNDKIDEQWNLVSQQYENFHGSIFNC